MDDSSDKVLRVLEEIRDIQRDNQEKFSESLSLSRQSVERQKTMVTRSLVLLGIALVLIIISVFVR